MNSLRQILYISRCANTTDRPSIESILQVSRRNNRRRDITGCLLLAGPFFAQVLEGRADAVGPLSVRIASDIRHVGYEVISDRLVTIRKYSDWAMAFVQNAALANDLAAVLATEAAARDPEALLSRIHPDPVSGAL